MNQWYWNWFVKWFMICIFYHLDFIYAFFVSQKNSFRNSFQIQNHYHELVIWNDQKMHNVFFTMFSSQCFLLMQKVNVIVIIILLKELNESKKKESNSNYEIVYCKCSYWTQIYIRWFVCFALLFKCSSMFECKFNIGDSVITL